MTTQELLIDVLCRIRNEINITAATVNATLIDFPCKELQNISMDLESADQHIASLIENGPSDPYVDIDFVQSEEDIWKEPAEGPSQGDVMMSSEW